ncbi:hypothetical protein FRC03_005656 [Tulasnella sp. 419]|nr:hypothetical protein FRC03_005656 [Tulasnella sp. 419]
MAETIVAPPKVPFGIWALEDTEANDDKEDEIEQPLPPPGTEDSSWARRGGTGGGDGARAYANPTEDPDSILNVLCLLFSNCESPTFAFPSSKLLPAANFKILSNPSIFGAAVVVVLVLLDEDEAYEIELPSTPRSFSLQCPRELGSNPTRATLFSAPSSRRITLCYRRHGRGRTARHPSCQWIVDVCKLVLPCLFAEGTRG